MKKKNEKFANDARAGKKPTKLSHQDRLAKRSPISLWALGIVLFVVIGGGASSIFDLHIVMLTL
jgi:Ribosome associated membrane protein RAMP4